MAMCSSIEKDELEGETKEVEVRAEKDGGEKGGDVEGRIGWRMVEQKAGVGMMGMVIACWVAGVAWGK